jgi:hypothetical protein
MSEQAKCESQNEARIMDEDAAMKLAREFLAYHIQLTFHKVPPPGVHLYGFNPDDEYLFSYGLAYPRMIGGSNYISVSRISGEVRYLGFAGE